MYTDAESEVRSQCGAGHEIYGKRIAKQQHTQPLSRKYKQIHLSKEACTANTGRQREAAHCYNKDLNAVWAQINEATQNIVTTHTRVYAMFRVTSTWGVYCPMESTWNAFIWKKEQDNQADKSK